MSPHNIRSLARLLGLVVVLSTFPALSAEPQLQTPEDGATISLMPKAILEYKTPEERGWDAPYKIDDLKQGQNECSKPTPVRFEWTWDGAATANFTVQVATNAEFSDAKEFASGAETFVEAQNLKIGTTYYWRVSTSLPCADASYSAARSFKTDGALPQWYDVAGISNVRDSGGWKVGEGKRVKFGMVYRGTEMDAHLPIQEAGIEFMLNELGIKTDLDLRGKSEWGGQEDRDSPLGASVRWVNFPVSGYGGISSDETKAMYRDIFKLFAQAETYPVYIHCMGGADRCGTLNIALKALLGVSDNDLCHDYEMTSFSVIGERNITSSYFQDFRKYMASFGGSTLSEQFEGYLKSVGVTQEEIDAIRALLLEDVE